MTGYLKRWLGHTSLTTSFAAPNAVSGSIRREIPVVVKNEKDTTLVCHAADGSLETFSEALVYKQLAIIRRLRFDRRLPWTNKSLYE